MATYLVESYMPGASACRAAAAAARAGTDRRTEHRWSLVIPEEDVCLHVFDAPSLAVVREALAHAAVGCQRISEVVVVVARPVETEGG